MEQNETIYLDRQGIQQYIAQIKLIEKQLNECRMQKTESCNRSGEGYHDNFDFEDGKREELRLLFELKRLLMEFSKVKEVKMVDCNDTISINDYVTANIKYSDGDSEILTFKLVALAMPKHFADIKEVSINSPLGKSVYQKQTGDTVSYTVEDNMVLVDILNCTKIIDNDLDDKTL